MMALLALCAIATVLWAALWAILFVRFDPPSHIDQNYKRIEKNNQRFQSYKEKKEDGLR